MLPRPALPVKRFVPSRTPPLILQMKKRRSKFLSVFMEPQENENSAASARQQPSSQSSLSTQRQNLRSADTRTPRQKVGTMRPGQSQYPPDKSNIRGHVQGQEQQSSTFQQKELSRPLQQSPQLMYQSELPGQTHGSRFDQPQSGQRSSPKTRSPQRDMGGRSHQYDTNARSGAVQYPQDGYQSRSTESNSSKSRHQGNAESSNLLSASSDLGDMTRSPIEQSPHLSGGALSSGSDFPRNTGEFLPRRGSAEKLLQSVLDECESLIDGLKKPS